jgi:hypothetical protein
MMLKSMSVSDATAVFRYALVVAIYFIAILIAGSPFWKSATVAIVIAMFPVAPIGRRVPESLAVLIGASRIERID